MTKKFCKDCPCLWGTCPCWCTHNPEWVLVEEPNLHYCILGRERMAMEEAKKLAEIADQRIQESFEVKADDQN